MRIAVVHGWVPFVYGGAEHLVNGLTAKLVERGHEATLIRLPFRWQPPAKVVEHMLACRLVRLENVDRVIGVKFPAYYVPHPNKVLWLCHQFRQAYDFWGTPLQDLPRTAEGQEIRRTIVESDGRFLPEHRKIYTISPVVSERLKRFNGIDSEVLYHPLLEPAGLRCDGYGDYVFFPSRINSCKRQFLAAEAMKYVKTPVRLVLAGAPETDRELEKLRAIISKNGTEDRIQLIPRFISEKEKQDLLAGALACAYLPYDEDSYGYVTLEAYHCRKPVITSADSGGTLILVRDGETGLVSQPTPQGVAEAMDRLYRDRRLAQRLGDRGHELMVSLKINWDNVVEKLTT